MKLVQNTAEVVKGNVPVFPAQMTREPACAAGVAGAERASRSRPYSPSDRNQARYLKVTSRAGYGLE